jgi:hypothetical protein
MNLVEVLKTLQNLKALEIEVLIPVRWRYCKEGEELEVDDKNYGATLRLKLCQKPRLIFPAD